MGSMLAFVCIFTWVLVASALCVCDVYAVIRDKSNLPALCLPSSQQLDGVNQSSR